MFGFSCDMRQTVHLRSFFVYMSYLRGNLYVVLERGTKLRTVPRMRFSDVQNGNS